MRQLKNVQYCAGLAMLGIVGLQAQAQQAHREPSPRPGEKLEFAPIKKTVHPVQFDWSELVQIQASLPKGVGMGSSAVEQLEQAAAGSSEAPEDIVLPDPTGQRQKNQRLPTVPEGGIERLGSCTGFPVIPPVSLSINGQSDGPDSFATLYYPPNPAGGVGPNHLMVMAPNFTLIQDRLGATISSIDTITFWAPTGAASVTYCRLDYDDVNGRWHAIARGGSGVGGTSILFAISDTDDPTGGWDYYSIPADPTLLPPTFADNLNKGYNQTWVVVTAEMYSSTVVGGNQGSRVYTFDVAGALAGGPVVANTFPSNYVTAVTGQGAATVNWRNIPTRSLDGSLADIHLLNTRLATASSPIMQLVKITGTGVAPTIVPAIFGSGFGDPSCLFFIPFDYTNVRQAVFQVGDIRGIDPIPPDGTFASSRARLADAVVRNGKLWIVQNHGLPAPAGAAATQNGLGFYELDPAGPIVGNVGPFNQQAQVSDGINTTCFYPSIAVNCAEDVLVGFSRSDLTKNLEAAYVVRLGSDAPNTMGPTTTLKVGESSWWQLGQPPATTLGSWGYYSSSAIDPNDDTTLWTLQPYAAQRVGPADNDSRWGTRWGRLGECGNPSITDEPDSVSVCLPDPTSFSVTATPSVAPIAYQWRKDGTPIPGATSSTYSIGTTVVSDGGIYDVVVYDGCGSSLSLPATLAFSGPIITTQPTDYITPMGGPAAFFVVATPASGSLSYQWYHGNTPVGTNDDIYIIGATVISDYSPSNEYRCVVSDNCGPVATNTVKLRFPPKNNFDQAEFALHIFKSPTSVFSCTGDTATFSVVAFPPSVTYEWRKNGTPIFPAETGSSLTLSGLSAGDAASYDVVVSLGARSRTSSAAALTVNDAPVITVNPTPSSQTVNPGDFVNFSVTATGTGTLTYQWQIKPQVPFAAWAQLVGAVGSTLTVGPITSGDAGQYRCVVTNECGLDRSTASRVIVN